MLSPPSTEIKLCSAQRMQARRVGTMVPHGWAHSFCLQVLFFVFSSPFTYALKFDLVAHPGHSTKNERCIRNFVNRDTLVVVTATISGSKGDGQVVNMHVGQPEEPFCGYYSMSLGQRAQFPVT